MKKKSLFLVFILVFVWIVNTSSARGAENLKIGFSPISEDYHNTDTPFNIYVDVSNPDSVNHSYTVMVRFDNGPSWSQSGYIVAGDYRTVIVTAIVSGSTRIVPVTVYLYQDFMGAYGDYVDSRTVNWTFERGLLQLQLSDMANQIQSLQAQLNSFMFALTAISIGVVVSAALAIVTWLATRKRKTDETAPKPNAPHNQTL